MLWHKIDIFVSLIFSFSLFDLSHLFPNFVLVCDPGVCVWVCVCVYLVYLYLEVICELQNVIYLYSSDNCKRIKMN